MTSSRLFLAATLLAVFVSVPALTPVRLIAQPAATVDPVLYKGRTSGRVARSTRMRSVHSR